MLTGREEIIRQLCFLSDEFRVHMRNRQWHRAKAAYDTARTVSSFLQLDTEDRIRLFGSRSYADDHDDGPQTEGLFPEQSVLYAYEQVIRSREQDPYWTGPAIKNEDT